MVSSKLIQYLEFLSKSELSAFQAFVDSPYYNKHENTRKLMNFISQYIQSPDRLTKKNAFSYVFPKEPYQEQLISNLISYLLKLLRKFYSTHLQQDNKAVLQLNLLENALLHQNEKLFTLSSKKLSQEIQSSQLRDSNYYFIQHQHQRLSDKYDIQFGKRDDGAHLEHALQNFQVYTIGENLKMACQMLARKQVTGRAYQSIFLNEIVRFVETEKPYFTTLPSVWNYFIIYKMMTDSSHEYYYELKERLRSDVSFFNHQEGRDLFTHALNYCIGQLNTGANKFRKESFELYQQMLENKLLFTEGQIPQWDYTNIVALGCELQEYEWVKSFIEEQKTALPPAYALNTYTYNLAAFYYAQKEYDLASDLLIKVEFKELYYHLVTRILLLRIYFEQREWEALNYNMENFRIFLLRTKKIEEKRRKSGLNLLRFTKQLSKAIERQDTVSKKEFENKLKTIKIKINQTTLLLNRSWLIQRIDSLLVNKG